MTDRAVDPEHLRSTWRSLGCRVAVAGGCLVALVSLFHHVPVSTASLRGGVAFVALRLIARWGLFAVEQALGSGDARKTREGEPH